MCKLKKEHIAQIKEQKQLDEQKLQQLQQALTSAWNDVPKYLELLRERRIVEGRIHIAKIKIRNLERGKEILAA